LVTIPVLTGDAKGMKMRLGLVIVALALIAAGKIYLSRSEMTVRYEVQQIRTERRQLRDDKWEMEVNLGRQTTPMAVRERLRQIEVDQPADFDPTVTMVNGQ